MKLSIITAVFNNTSHIRDAIESVLDQATPSFSLEYIIIDGGSTDGTLNVINEYSDKISVIISEKDNGIYDALNKGLGLATGDIIGFLHSDDILATRYTLQNIMFKFTQNPTVSGIYGDLQYVDKDDTSRTIRNWISGEFSIRSLKKGWMPPHPTLYLKKSIYEQFGYFNLDYRISADYEFMMRVLKQEEIKLGYLPEVIVKMRVGGASNRSLKNLYIKSTEDLRAMKHNQIGGIRTLFLKNFRKLPQFIKKI